MRLGTSSPARLVLAVGLAGVLAPLAATASSAGVSQAGPVKVTGTSTNVFDPKEITATPDATGKVTIEFVSSGFHRMESTEGGFDSGDVSSTTKTFSFTAKPGTYEFICRYHAPGMTGTLTVSGGAAATTPPATEEPTEEPTETPTVSEPPASASASATVGTADDHAPLPGEQEHDPKDPFKHIPGVEGNQVLEDIETERAAQAGAVSGFKFFTFVSIAFLFILGAAVLASTRSRRAAR